MFERHSMKKTLVVFHLVLGSRLYALEGPAKQEVQSVIRANLNQVRYCYEQLLVVDKQAKGKIKVLFTIGTDGRVTKTNVTEDTVGSPRLAGCVVGSYFRYEPIFA